MAAGTTTKSVGGTKGVEGSTSKVTRIGIVNAVHRDIRFFQGECRIFAQRVETYAEQLIDRCEKQRAGLMERLGDKAFHGFLRNGFATSPANEALAEERTAGPSEDGYVWSGGDDCLFLDWQRVRRQWLPHWRRKQDGNPLLWFIAADKRRSGAYVYLGYGMASEDQTLHDAVLLSIAHDTDPSVLNSEPRVFDEAPGVSLWDRPEFFRQVANALANDGGDSRLQRAWNRVEAELDKRGARASSGVSK